MKSSNIELKAYESIIQNLCSLKEKASITGPGEAKAIEAILQSLFELSDGLQLKALSINQANEAVKAQDNGYNKILVQA